MNIILSLFAFMIAIFVLVFVHEFGHFWAAKKLGVKILKFSIGFGTVLLKKQIGETTFVFSAIPLGGFVKMLDKREMTVDDTEKHREFTSQPLISRILIVVAGPMANFIFAILAYWMIFMIGITGMPPIIDQVTNNSYAAKAQFHQNDKIISINNEPVLLWQDILEKITTTAAYQTNIPITVINSTNLSEQRQLILNTDGFLDSPTKWISNLGLTPKLPEFPAIIDKITPNSAASLAGLQAGDKILMIDNIPINSWQEMVTIIQSKAKQNITIQIQRPNESVMIKSLTPKTRLIDGKAIGHIGIQLARLPSEFLVTAHYGLWESFTKAIYKTWSFSKLTLTMIGKMLVGSVALKENIGGPISIAKIAGISFSSGFISFVGFLAIISISLGVLNLLPIPVLDGGHLLLYLLEFIKGSALSETLESNLQKIGMTLIAILMIFTIYNDINKLL